MKEPEVAKAAVEVAVLVEATAAVNQKIETAAMRLEIAAAAATDLPVVIENLRVAEKLFLKVKVFSHVFARRRIVPPPITLETAQEATIIRWVFCDAAYVRDFVTV